MDLIAYTTLLVGLWRRQAWAMSFAKANPGRCLGLPWVVLGEFWPGARRAGHDPALVRQFLALGLPLLDPEPVIPAYAAICTTLQAHHPAARGAPSATTTCGLPRSPWPTPNPWSAETADTSRTSTACRSGHSPRSDRRPALSSLSRRAGSSKARRAP